MRVQLMNEVSRDGPAPNPDDVIEVQLLLPQVLLSGLEARARRDGLTVAQFIRRTLTNHLTGDTSAPTSAEDGSTVEPCMVTEPPDRERAGPRTERSPLK